MEAARYVDAVGRAYKAGQIIAIADRVQTRAVIRFAKVLELTTTGDVLNTPALLIRSYDGARLRARLKRPALMTRLDAAIVLHSIQIPADVEKAFDDAE